MSKNKHKTKRIQRGTNNPSKPLYLNANLIYSEAIGRITGKKKNEISGTLFKLNEEGYNLFTSVLTRMEVVQRLIRDRSKKSKSSRDLYLKILDDFKIAEINALENHVPLTDAHLDGISGTNLDFKDSLHLSLAKKLKMPVCTHDKKMRHNFSQHGSKKKYYSEVYKPEELIKPRKN